MLEQELVHVFFFFDKCSITVFKSWCRFSSVFIIVVISSSVVSVGRKSCCLCEVYDKGLMSVRGKVLARSWPTLQKYLLNWLLNIRGLITLRLLIARYSILGLSLDLLTISFTACQDFFFFLLSPWFFTNFSLK